MKKLFCGAIMLSALAVCASTSVRAQTDTSARPRNVNANGAATIVITRASERPTATQSMSNFTGSLRVDPMFSVVPAARAAASLVSFDAGARTAWHTHPREQILIVMSGTGRVAQWEASPHEIRPGDVVRIPPNTKHWHGAAPTSAMSHIAIVEALDGRTVEWMELVSDAQFRVAPSAASMPTSMPASTSPPNPQR